MHHFFLFLWPGVLTDGSSLIGLLFCRMDDLCVIYVKSHMLMVSAAEGFGWFCSVGCLHWVTGRLETVLDAVPEGRYLAGFTCLSQVSGFHSVCVVYIGLESDSISFSARLSLCKKPLLEEKGRGCISLYQFSFTSL